MLWYILVRNYVADGDAPTSLEHAEYLREQLPSILWSNQVQHAVGNDAVHAFTPDEWLLAPQAFFKRTQDEPALLIAHRITSQLFGQQIQIELQVLDHPTAECDVGITQSVDHRAEMSACESQHLLIAIDTDDTASRAHDLRGNVTDFAATGAEIEYRVAWPDIRSRITAAVIPFQNLLRDHRQVTLVIIHRAAQL